MARIAPYLLLIKGRKAGRDVSVVFTEKAWYLRLQTGREEEGITRTGCRSYPFALIAQRQERAAGPLRRWRSGRRDPTLFFAMTGLPPQGGFSHSPGTKIAGQVTGTWRDSPTRFGATTPSDLHRCLPALENFAIDIDPRAARWRHEHAPLTQCE